MPTFSSARNAVNILRELEIKVPTLPDVTTGTNGTAFTFKISATLHSLRPPPTVPDFLSSPARIQSDIIRAMHLASLLDEDREIPVGQRLSEFILEPAVVEAVKKPVEHLDVAIAYLRRVHFVSFYSGKRFRDESHLLIMAASPICRSRPFAPNPNENTPYSITTTMDEMKDKSFETTQETEAEVESEKIASEDKVAEMAEQDNKEADDGEVKSESGQNEEPKAEEESNKEENQEVTQETPSKALVPISSPSSGAPQATTPTAMKLNLKSVVFNDRKLGPIISDLTQKLARKKLQQTDPTVPGSVDEDEAKQLEAIQDKTFDELMKSRCKFEVEDKCRCCYVYCNKLFRAVSFLSKHLKTKHGEFGAEELLRDAEPFMRRRYESEDMHARPLPPIEIETANGIELRSVKEIMDKYMPSIPAMMAPPLPFGPPPTGGQHPPPLPLGPPPSRYTNDRYDDRDYRDGGNRKRSRFNDNNRGGGGGRDNYNNNYNDNQGADSGTPNQGDGGSAEKPNERRGGGLFTQRKSFGGPKVNPYLDIDAPKVSLFLKFDFLLYLLLCFPNFKSKLCFFFHFHNLLQRWKNKPINIMENFIFFFVEVTSVYFCSRNELIFTRKR
jgi:hypothetical protein